MSLHDKPEDNLVRAVVHSLITYFHPHFQQSAAEAERARSRIGCDGLKESDMRWQLSKRQSTMPHGEADQRADPQSSAVDVRALRDKE